MLVVEKGLSFNKILELISSRIKAELFWLLVEILFKGNSYFIDIVIIRPNSYGNIGYRMKRM